MEIQHILVIDDDTRIRDLLKKYLKDKGFYVSIASNAKEAREKMKQYKFDLLVVDVMMPGETGIQLTKSLKLNIEIPILMLTAMGEVEDRIKGLECGADDYLAKPFEPRELLLRIQSLLKRSYQQQKILESVSFGAYNFNTKTMILLKNGDEVSLTSTEGQLLSFFINNIDNIISREQIVAELSSVGERTVDVQIKRLRDKIESNSKQPRYLRTVRGKGYIFHNE